MSQANIVSFIEQRSDGSAQLVRLACKVDAEADDTLTWDCDFAFSLGNDEAVKLEESAIPSAREYRTRATDGEGSTVVKFRPVEDTIRLSLTSPSGAVVLSEASAKVRHLEMRTTEKVQVFIARVRVQAQPAADAGKLCACLGKRVGLVADPVQQQLFKAPALPPIGSVVSADGGVYGILKGEKDGNVIIDDFGVIHTAAKVISSISVANVDGPEVQRYARDADAPSWRKLVLALGEEIASGTCPGDEKAGWQITDRMVEAAGIPPEAGAARPATRRVVRS